MSNMTKAVPITTILLKISSLDSISSKRSSITILRLPFLLILLAILKVHWPYWHIWVLKAFLFRGQMNTFCYKTKPNSFGRQNQQMESTMVLYLLI